MKLTSSSLRRVPALTNTLPYPLLFSMELCRTVKRPNWRSRSEKFSRALVVTSSVLKLVKERWPHCSHLCKYRAIRRARNCKITRYSALSSSIWWASRRGHLLPGILCSSATFPIPSETLLQLEHQITELSFLNIVLRQIGRRTTSFAKLNPGLIPFHLLGRIRTLFRWLLVHLITYEFIITSLNIYQAATSYHTSTMKDHTKKWKFRRNGLRIWIRWQW